MEAAALLAEALALAFPDYAVHLQGSSAKDSDSPAPVIAAPCATHP